LRTAIDFDMADEEESKAPDGVTAQRLVKEFESVTNTDEILAQFYLQENDWNLTKALNTFFSEKCEAGEAASSSAAAAAPGPGTLAPAAIATALAAGRLTTQAPDSLTLVTWNIDGLDTHNLSRRTEAVGRELRENSADIVFLQEVVPETFSLLEATLTDYECIAAKQENYFVATLLRKGRVYLDRKKVVDFPTSRMYRHLLAVQAHCGSVRLDLMNTHLESTKEHATERKKQLEMCLGLVERRPADNTVLFGGDLNMRDSELAGLGGLPAGVRDVWEQLGSRKEVEHTWDMQRNTNLEMPGKWKPRLRFDRVYWRGSQAKDATPSQFGLLGLNKVIGTQSFPSDHWGIRLALKLIQK